MNSDKSQVYQRHYEKIVRLNSFMVSKFYISIGELSFVLAFLLNFLAGKIINSLAPSDEVNNYWNDKRNIFNQVFVKKGWLWTTIFLGLFYIFNVINSKRNSKINSLNYVKIGLRYLIFTGWWILFTQWCFGLPIMDRIFVLTGGYCFVSPDHPKIEQLIHLFDHNHDKNLLQSNSITSFSCRRLNGAWEGGHDPSGHVFLLVHSSLYLLFETYPYWQNYNYLYNSFKIHYSKFKISKNYRDLVDMIISMPQILIIGLVSLWWFMLLMTNVYFHSWAEKLVGLVFGYIAPFVTYYLPRVLNHRT